MPNRETAAQPWTLGARGARLGVMEGDLGWALNLLPLNVLMEVATRKA